MTSQRQNIPLSVSIIPVAFALSLTGCTLTAFAQAPLRSIPPRIVAEAGMLPTNILVFFDRLDEWVERTIFSFGLPSLRTRILLAHAAERIAELQALERAGTLTPVLTLRLLERHRQLLDRANRAVARQMERGAISPDLLLAVVRTRLAAAEVLEERAVEQRAFDELDPDVPEGAADDVGEQGVRADASVADTLEETADRLVDLEQDLGLARPKLVLAPEVFRLIVEQKIAKAERDLLRAGQAIEERQVQGQILVAAGELQRGAEATLATARQLSLGENFPEALSFAGQARTIARRLQSGKNVVHPDAEKSHQRVEQILDALLADGLVSVADRTVAAAWAHAAIDEARRQPPPDGG
jgi:hypothetical protein